MDAVSDDRLEQDLRRVLADPAHQLPDSLVPLERVHSGARRRKARRQALAAVAGATAGVLGVVGFVGVNHLLQRANGHVVTAASGASAHIQGSADQATATVPVGPTEPTPSQQPSSTASARPAAVPAGFAPLSVTAIGPNTWWVLGGGGALVSTVDGGHTFSYLGDSTSSGLPASAHDVRFADARHGWAVSVPDSTSTSSLWQTSDGGAKWQPVPLVGEVGAIELSGGEAYALVKKGADNWAVYEAAADGTRNWQSVGDLGSIPSQPLLAVQGKQAIVAATSVAPFRTWLSGAGGNPLSSDKPCSPDLGATSISATATGVWLSCAIGTSDSLYVSPDGVTWTPTHGGISTASRHVVGAIDGKSAAVAEADGRIYVVSTSGGDKPATGPFQSDERWDYLAFTNAHDGFALDRIGGRMLRTTDGGMSWTSVDFSG